jgi:hypothetical protein
VFPLQFLRSCIRLHTFFSLVKNRVISVLKLSWNVLSILRATTTEFYSQAEAITDNEYQHFLPYINPGCNVEAVYTGSAVRLRTEHGGHP